MKTDCNMVTENLFWIQEYMIIENMKSAALTIWNFFWNL